MLGIVSLYCEFLFCVFSSVSNHLAEEDRVGDFTLIMLLLCSVSLPHGAVCWSAACVGGISMSFSLAF